MRTVSVSYGTYVIPRKQSNKFIGQLTHSLEVQRCLRRDDGSDVAGEGLLKSVPQKVVRHAHLAGDPSHFVEVVRWSAGERCAS